MNASILRLVAAAWIAGMTAEASSPTWKGATTYPTTVTRVWSRTFTSKGATPTAASLAGAAPETPPESTAAAAPASIAIQTVTMYEPWTKSPNPEYYPYTLLQTAITKRQEYVLAVDSGGHTSTSTLSMAPTAATRTVTSTWLIWDTSPTDLAADQALPACDTSKGKDEGAGEKGCATPNLKQDRRCIDHGLATACHSQCKIRRVEGWDVWWCQKLGEGRTRNDRRAGADAARREVALGRVCTDSMGYYEQLLEPCDTMDHAHDCPPCSS